MGDFGIGVPNTLLEPSHVLRLFGRVLTVNARVNSFSRISLALWNHKCQTSFYPNLPASRIGSWDPCVTSYVRELFEKNTRNLDPTHKSECSPEAEFIWIGGEKKKLLRFSENISFVFVSSSEMDESEFQKLINDSSSFAEQ